MRELQRTAGNAALRRIAGAPLDAGLRAAMEEQLGTDLGHVRLYADREAGSDAGRLAAAAFARGASITFAAGMYRPETDAGRVVLAHELAHVVQQTRNAGWPSSGPAGLEAEADAAAVHGQTVVGSASQGAIQRLPDLLEDEEERLRKARAAFPAASDRPVKARLTPSPDVLRPSPFDVAPTPEAVAQARTGATGPPRKGSLGDVLGALAEVPGVKRLIDQERDKLGRLSKGERILVGSVLVPLAGGAIAGILTDKPTREMFDNAELPVPGVPWLHLKVFTKGSAGGVLQIDVFRLPTDK